MERYQAGFIDLFLKDSHLLLTLEARTDWVFTNEMSIIVTMDTLPWFRLRARCVDLAFTPKFSNPWGDDHPWANDWTPSSINAGIQHMPQCRWLTTLTLRCCKEETIDLEHIVNCYRLERLRILHPYDFINSLSAQAKLQSLVIDGGGRLFTGRHILPFDSASTLTHLSILCSRGEFVCDRDCANEAFDIFVNLKSLFVHPLSDDMCDLLLRGSLRRLESFRTTVTRLEGFIDIKKVVDVLAGPSLRSLKTLRIIIDYDEAWTDDGVWCPYYEDIAETITTNIDQLGLLVLGMGLNALWFPKFTRLRELKTLVWYAPLGYWKHDNASVLVASNVIRTRTLQTPILYKQLDIIIKAGRKQFEEVFQAEDVQIPSIDLLPFCSNGTRWREYVDICRCDVEPFLYDDRRYDRRYAMCSGQLFRPWVDRNDAYGAGGWEL